MNWIKSAFRRLAGAAPAARGAQHASPPSPRDAALAEEKFALGRALRESGRLAEAIDAFMEAIAVRHDYVDAIVALAGACAESGRNEDAADHYFLALAFDAGCAPAHLGVGRLLREQGRYDEAIRHFRLAARSPAQPAAAWFELGLTLKRPECAAEAEAAYRRALELRPDYAEAAVNLGLILLGERGDPGAAEALFRRAAAIDPALPAATVNLGLALQEQGRFEEAIAEFDRGMLRHPGVPDLLWHRAMTRLIEGDYERGWDDHEARKRIFGGRYHRAFPYAEWNGEPLAGRSILVYGEQGLGDEIMFASCIPDLVERGARCIVECDSRLAPLYERSFPEAIVHGGSRDEDRAWLARHPAIEFQAAVGSLPRFVRRSPADFPRREGYLFADAGSVRLWRDRLAALGGRLKVGISWQGGTPKNRSTQRSIPLELWNEVLQVPDVCFASLQRGIETPAAVAAAPQAVIHHWPDAVASVDETAALIAALDLIVTIDSTVAHLAGALGRPARILLSASPDWRWRWDGETIPWYPSARAVRRARGADWAPVMAQVAGELNRLARSAP
jgi:tetratricopeptide (TPR) repeat protein